MADAGLVAANLTRRFIEELPLWRLSGGQFLLLLLWAAWPSLAGWVFPGSDALALGPVFVFLPFVYVVGYPLIALLPGLSGQMAHSLALGSTVFVLAYLCLVSWRQGRKRRAKAAKAANVLGGIVLLSLVAFLIYLVFWVP